MITKAVPPREIRVLPRGNWMDKSGEVVAAAHAALPDADRRRAAAGRIGSTWPAGSSSRDNPLTARVVVNRLWKQYFGIGLSKMLIDMGSQGEVPPNQELLDWLAIEFMDSGWDMKHMVRLMVTSSAYRQSSLPRPELDAIDPENRLVGPAVAVPARGRADSRQRAGGERPAGEQVGGDIVRPYQPAEVLRAAQFSRARLRRRRPATISSAGRCTSIGSGSICTRGCWRSTRRRARNARPSGRSRTRPPRRWCC